MASASIFPSAWEIPVDFTVRKGLSGLIKGDMTIHDAYDNLRFQVRSRLFNSSPWRVKTLLDASGNTLITCVNRQGGWEGFRGNSLDSKDAIFTAHKTVTSPFDAELKVFLMNGSLAQRRLAFRVKVAPFRGPAPFTRRIPSLHRLASPNFKLGKVIHSRHKFRLTVYPRIDHALVAAILVIFFGGH
ncbi:unnamed protein product [Spirodela intermedia]|uniref:Uncharacterized protein n=1 Tax=Spirodela intermedia TaxID=51605 RepID=A0A7I8IAR6_SPIIN|nr:unnamed protein product [Spirodela intermedia]CAA6654668.1 unnamed protein product [Spirodela intermedia]